MLQGIPICAHPWAYAARQPEHDIVPILDRIFSDLAQAQFDGIELMHTVFDHAGSIEKAAALADQHGLRVVGSSFGGKMWDRTEHEAVRRAAERTLDGLAALGGETLGVSTGPKPGERKTAAELNAQAELLTEIIALADARGVTLNLHNHTYEAKDNEYEIQAMIDRIPDVKLGPDLNWLLRAGVDPFDFLRRRGERVVFLHLRDEKDGRWVEALGEGEFDFAKLARVLEEIGFDGIATVELAHERDVELSRPLGKCFRISREHIRQTMRL